MAEESRSLTKVKENLARAREYGRKKSEALKEAMAGAEDNNKKASKVPPWALVIEGAVWGTLTGAIDGAVSTSAADLHKAGTLVLGGVAEAVSIGGHAMGQPTVATLAGTAAACSAAIVANQLSFEKSADAYTSMAPPAKT